MGRYASVYPLVTARALARPFTYEVTEEAGVGSVVEVRFGNARRRGVVTEVGVEPPEGVEAAPVERVADAVPPALVDLALWLADYYGSTPGRALQLVAPVKPKRRKLQAPPAARAALESDEREPASLSEPQARALARVESLLASGGG